MQPLGAGLLQAQIRYARGYAKALSRCSLLRPASTTRHPTNNEWLSCLLHYGDGHQENLSHWLHPSREQRCNWPMSGGVTDPADGKSLTPCSAEHTSGEVKKSCKLGMCLPRNAAAERAQPASALVLRGVFPSGGITAPLCGSGEIKCISYAAQECWQEIVSLPQQRARDKFRAAFRGELKRWRKARRIEYKPREVCGLLLCVFEYTGFFHLIYSFLQSFLHFSK